MQALGEFDSWQGRQAETALSSSEIPSRWVCLDERLCKEYASARPVKISGSPISNRGVVCAFEPNDVPAHMLTVRLSSQDQSLKSDDFGTAKVSFAFEARRIQDHLYIGVHDMTGFQAGRHNIVKFGLMVQAYAQTSTFSKQAVPPSESLRQQSSASSYEMLQRDACRHQAT